MSSIYFSLLFLLIPLCLGITAIFLALIAHRGHATSGTWTLLISASIYSLTIISFGFAQYFFISSFLGSSHGAGTKVGTYDFDFYEQIMMITSGVFVLSILGYSLGILFMSRQWASLSKETSDLEELAQTLAREREQPST